MINQRVGNPEAKKSLDKAQGIDISGATLLLDSYLSVWCRAGSATGQRTGPGGAAESSAGASLTHVGQSSVEIGLMNRRGRAKTVGLLVFQYSPVIISWTSTHLHATGRGSDREVSGWHIRTSEKDCKQEIRKTKHLLLKCHNRFRMEIREYNLYFVAYLIFFLSLCMQCSLLASVRVYSLVGLWSMTSPLQARLPGCHFPLMDHWAPDRTTSLNFNSITTFCTQTQRRCKLLPIIRLSKNQLTPHLLTFSLQSLLFLKGVCSRAEI